MALTVEQVKDVILDWYKMIQEEEGGYDRRVKESLGEIYRYIEDLLDGLEGEL